MKTHIGELKLFNTAGGKIDVMNLDDEIEMELTATQTEAKEATVIEV